MQEYDQPGKFYLGKKVDPSTGEIKDDLVLYDSKNFTTHAVCLGMTGSGKTGLGITILEEAGLDRIPAIIIDPKGDLGNLMLTFPELSATEFLPWIDTSEAEQKGMQPEQYAELVAKNWKEGLAKWGEGPERIKKLKSTIEPVIYTPANNAGIPLSILSSFSVPSKSIMEDPGALRDRIMSIASSLLGLLGINADPIKSREHILISALIEYSWRQGNDLDLSKLIRLIQKPPYNQIGALDRDTFFPAKERKALSISLNNLLASPGFQAWMEGEPLDIERLFYTIEGKPKFSIITISHLSDSERMFFVTLLLNEILSWMRNQAGTSNLKALLYMDEIYGFFPPTAMPPSKVPMLTLLKQARAYGLGIILATQNPVDLDYKALSNCGTWFIGKLQTLRDRMRVCEGLKIASNGQIDVDTLNNMLAEIGNRTFIMRSIYEKEPILFTTRWALSYLRGPLTLSLIKKLTKTPYISKVMKQDLASNDSSGTTENKPMMPQEVLEWFLNKSTARQASYKIRLCGKGKLHYVDAKYKIDEWQEISLLAPFDAETNKVLWEEGETISNKQEKFEKQALNDHAFDKIPSALLQAKSYLIFEKELDAYLYQNQTLEIYRAADNGIFSKPGESEQDFKVRLMLVLQEKRDETVRKLREKYNEKISILTNKIERSKEKLETRKQKTFWQIFTVIFGFLSTILGAIFGKKLTKGTITQTGTSIKRAGKLGMDNRDVNQAEESYQVLQKQLEDLQLEMQNEIDKINLNMNGNTVQMETMTIRPRKSDLYTDKISAVWVLE